MNPAIANLLNWVAVWCGVIVGLTLILNFITHGFFLKYLRVKGSRGKKVLVEVETLTDRYLAVGYITEGFLIYRKRHAKRGDNARITVPQNSVIKKLGVYFINVDEEKNAVQRVDYSVAEGFDAEKVEMLYKRALYKPNLQGNMFIILLIIVLILALFAIIDTVLLAQVLKKIGALNTIP